MTKWVENKDVNFSCQRDIWRYLVDGGCVVSRTGLSGYHHFNDDFTFSVSGYCYSDYKEWTPMKRAEWYEDIPENGVIGKAYPGTSEKYVIGICNGYDESHVFPFKCQNGIGYVNFIPMTKEEVFQYILPE